MDIRQIKLAYRSVVLDMLTLAQEQAVSIDTVLAAALIKTYCISHEHIEELFQELEDEEVIQGFDVNPPPSSSASLSTPQRHYGPIRIPRRYRMGRNGATWRSPENLRSVQATGPVKGETDSERKTRLMKRRLETAHQREVQLFQDVQWFADHRPKGVWFTLDDVPPLPPEWKQDPRRGQRFYWIQCGWELFRQKAWQRDPQTGLFHSLIGPNPEWVGCPWNMASG